MDAYKRLPRDHELRKQYESMMRAFAPIGVERQIVIITKWLPYILGAGLLLNLITTRDLNSVVVFGMLSLAGFGFFWWVARKKEEKWEHQRAQLNALNAKIEEELSRLDAEQA